MYARIYVNMYFDPANKTNLIFLQMLEIFRKKFRIYFLNIFIVAIVYYFHHKIIPII